MSDRALKLIPKPKGYNQDAIKILEEALALAKEGEVIQLVLMYENDGRHNADGFGDFVTQYTPSLDLVTLVGHLEKMKFSMLRRMKVIDD